MGGQDWKASSLDTAIRNQLSTRIQFKAQDRTQSRILLGAPDAALLDRPGRAYAILPGRPRLELQAPFVSVPTITRYLVTEGLTQPTPPPTPISLELPEDELTERVIHLFDTGETMTAICKQMFGYKNQAKLERIKDILVKCGRIVA